ncbi:ligand-dependent nuclear receptor corepressor-like protein isoform X4 [Salminus brasiliensis]|uniref:ligand-dependent nuclear receptor corepressor-like protein isoform X4 n=1 Tax=Salminus brasiliensis TaxID=930266 RepID=UPI003B830476
MATRCRSAKCAAERRGARRELETWRHKLIACVGFESILEGIYGPRLLQDLSIFDDCEPEATSDWSTDACCPFCSLQLEKLTDHVPVSPPPAETPPPQGLSTSERLQCQADQFLHAVFHKKEFPENCDPSIPLAAQELMRKMIRQFAIEYACKSHSEGPEDPSVNQADFPKQAELDGPLDLTVSRGAPCRDLAVSSVAQCPQQEGVLDLSKKSTSSLNVPSQQAVSGRPIREEYLDRSSEFAEGLLSKALKDVRSGSLDVHKAAILYGIPQKTLRLQAEALLLERKPWLPVGDSGGGPEVGWPAGETQLLLQKVAAWARSQSDQPEGAKVAFSPAESADLPAAIASSYLHRLTLQRMVSQLRERSDGPPSNPSMPTPPQSPAAGAAVAIRIPQVRPTVQPKTQLDLAGLVDAVFQANKSSESPAVLHKLKTILPKQGVSECPPVLESRLLLQGDLPPLCMKNGAVGVSATGGSATGSGEICGDDGERRDKQPRKKRGRYRQYDHDILEEAIAMVMGGKMSVSKAQGVYGVPHSTLEYKVKERMGTLKTPPKKKLRLSEAKTSGSIHSGTTTTNASTTAFKRF